MKCSEKNEVKKTMKCSEKNEFIKERWGGPTYKLRRGSWGPTFKFWRRSWGSNFKFWGGSQVPDPGILVPLLHHAVLASDHSQIIILYTSYIAQVYFTLTLFTKYIVIFKMWIDNWRMVLAKWFVKKSVERIVWYKKSKEMK